MNYPIFLSPSGKEYQCIFYAADILGMTGYEWFGFEIAETTSKDILYYGWIDGIEKEFGYFSFIELKGNGAAIYDTPNELANLKPPRGWIKKTDEIDEIINEIDFTVFNQFISEAERDKKMIEDALQKIGNNFWLN